MQFTNNVVNGTEYWEWHRVQNRKYTILTTTVRKIIRILSLKFHRNQLGIWKLHDITKLTIYGYLISDVVNLQRDSWSMTCLWICYQKWRGKADRIFHNPCTSCEWADRQACQIEKRWSIELNDETHNNKRPTGQSLKLLALLPFSSPLSVTLSFHPASPSLHPGCNSLLVSEMT